MGWQAIYEACSGQWVTRGRPEDPAFNTPLSELLDGGGSVETLRPQTKEHRREL